MERKMTGYVPKEGDKVRATLGAMVLEGQITHEYSHDQGWELTPGLESGEDYTIWASDGWDIQQIIAVPTTYLAIIQRADGEVFVRRMSNAYTESHPWRAVGGAGMAVTTEQATEGGFSIVYGGREQ